MLAVPTDIPVTTPVAEPAVKMDVFPLLQVPPGTWSLRIVAAPRQMVVFPEIVEGNGVTVILLLVVQPVGNV